MRSLQALELTNQNDSDAFHLDNDLIMALMNDFGMSENKATDIYYTSKTFAMLTDEATGLYKKSWQEIFKMLITELKIYRPFI
jgi:hypothetical protein